MNTKLDTQLHIYSVAEPWYALTVRSKGYRLRSQVMKTVTVTWLLVKCAAVAIMLPLLLAWDCMSYDLLRFIVMCVRLVGML